MSEIHPIGAHQVDRIDSKYTREGASHPALPDASVQRGDDAVELSTTARLVNRLDQISGIREDVVTRVREEIEAGTYDTDDKLDLAIERLAEDL